MRLIELWLSEPGELFVPKEEEQQSPKVKADSARLQEVPHRP